MQDYSKEYFRYFSSFAEGTWYTWIRDRGHGVDSLTDIPLTRDPNPHLLVVHAYHSLTNDEERRKCLTSLVNVVKDTFIACEQQVSLPASRRQNFDDELLALERLLHILNGLDAADLERLGLRRTALRVCKGHQDLVSDLPESQHLILRRRAIAVRSQLGDLLPDREIRKALKSEGTYVVAFRHALQSRGTRAVGDYLPLFVRTAFEIDKRVSIKAELFRVSERCGGEQEAQLSDQLLRALYKMPPEHERKVRSIAEEVGIRVVETRPVKRVIRSRQGTLVTMHHRYVGGDRYNDLLTWIVKALVDRNEATESPHNQRTFPWNELATLLVTNNCDFCGDPFFLDDTRAYTVNVLQIGWIKHFSAVVWQNSYIYDSYLTKGQGRFDRRLKKAMLDHGDIQIGLYAGTAASNEVLNALHDAPALSARTPLLASSSKELADWLLEDSNNRIVFCDHGISRDVRDICFQKSSAVVAFLRAEPPELRDKKLVFSFRRALPVGLAYPRYDSEWRRELCSAVREVILGHFDHLNWDAISKELVSVGIEPLSLEALSEQVGCLASFLGKALQKASAEGQYEKAQELKNKLEAAKTGKT